MAARRMVQPATATVEGTVKQAQALANLGAQAATATDAVGADTVSKADIPKLSTVNAGFTAVVNDINMLKTNLRSAGIQVT